MSAAHAPGPASELLTDAVVRRGWLNTFSTENPFCPCDFKSFTKAVRWTEMMMLRQRGGDGLKKAARKGATA